VSRGLRCAPASRGKKERATPAFAA
jgi:hypothetical protein